jgi:hypothetical protein
VNTMRESVTFCNLAVWTIETTLLF